MEEMVKVLNLREDYCKKNKDKCLVLITKYLRYTILKPIEDLDANPLDLVYGVHKFSAHGGYLPLSMVEALVSVNNTSLFCSLTRYFPLWWIYQRSFWKYICPRGYM